MKKMLLTGAMALMGLMVSAQGFMVTADIDTENFEVSTVTENLGFGYFVNDAFVVGAKMAADDNFNVFARYYWNENVFVSAEAPTEGLTDNLEMGVGYSFNVWNSLYVEPNYTMPLNEDAEGNREGAFNLGVAFRF